MINPVASSAYNRFSYEYDLSYDLSLNSSILFLVLMRIYRKEDRFDITRSCISFRNYLSLMQKELEFFLYIFHLLSLFKIEIKLDLRIDERARNT